MHKVFDITLRALDRRKGEMDRCKAIILCKGKSVFHHHHMSALFPYHALFPNQFPAGFKLGLDETNSFAALFQQPIQDRQHQLERNKGNINRSKIQQLRYLFFGNMADIGAFQIDNSFITAEFPCELSVADIDSIDLDGAVLQHAVGKTSGGSANVGTNTAIQPQSKFLHGLFQL